MDDERFMNLSVFLYEGKDCKGGTFFLGLLVGTQRR